jgi:hypothetical protein
VSSKTSSIIDLDRAGREPPDLSSARLMLATRGSEPEPEASSVARLAAWIDQNLSNAGTTSLGAPVPDPDTLSAYPPETLRTVLEASVKAYDAQVDLRKRHLELIRDQAQLELRRLELEHERMQRDRKLTEHRIDAEVGLLEHATKATAASLADKKRAAMGMALAGLITACVLGVASSPWIGGAIALASLASWLISQRGANESEALLAALPAPRARPALPERSEDVPSEDVEIDSRRADP